MMNKNNLNNELEHRPSGSYDHVAIIKPLFICNGWKNNQKCHVQQSSWAR